MAITKPRADEHAPVADEAEELEDDGEDWSDLDWGFGEEKRPLTTKELLESGLAGLWKDRTDIGDTLDFVRELRERRSHRSHRA